jgi:hypothetical protein
MVARHRLPDRDVGAVHEIEGNAWKTAIRAKRHGCGHGRRHGDARQGRARECRAIRLERCAKAWMRDRDFRPGSVSVNECAQLFRRAGQD